jgi:4-diphosphocytidyl-2-C-methyl-D-erythritol kinase
VKIEVNKRIPLVSGLGGDSSDAAATLRALNKLWGLGLSLEKLLELAAELGSDVAFFLYGGTALLKGRGEIVTPLPPLPHRWVVLVVPQVSRPPGKTGHLYARLKASHYTDGRITERLVETLKDGTGFTPSLLFNAFENITFARSAELGVYRSHMVKVGATNVHLAGSGPATFTLIKEKVQAEDMYIRCQQQNFETYLIDTSDILEKVE